MRFLRACFMFIVVFCFGLFALMVSAHAVIINVPGEYATIQGAINAANDGDTIVVNDDTYNETIDFLGKTIIVKSVNGADHTIIDAQAWGSVVTFNSGEGTGAVLDGFTLTDGAAFQGAGIYCEGSSPTISNCIISNNTADDDGGGIFCYSNSSPTIENCTITGNSTSGDYSDGGGIWIGSSSPKIKNCTITGNTVTGSGNYGRGGGIYWWNNSSPVVTDCTITGNTACFGGGIYARDNYPSWIIRCTISDNTASQDGGGIGCRSSAPIIYDCTISGNSATAAYGHGYGGGVYCTSASPTILDCTIINNSSHRGGGIYFTNSSPTISCCTIRNNSGGWTVGFGGGGGIYFTNSYSKITNCDISSNISGVNGGGIECWHSSTADIINCTVSDNDSQAGGEFYFGGGGIYVRDESEVTITNCTIANNICGDNGGGIRVYWNAHAHVVNSVVWDNFPAEIVVSGATSSIEINYSDIRGGWGAGVGNINLDPLFVGSGDYHITAGSPCIDAGTSDGAPLTDFEGDKRYDNPYTPNTGGGEYPYYDIGADEYLSTAIDPIPDIKANGLDDPQFVAPSESVDISISLDPGDMAGVWADWWGILLSSYGNFTLFGFQAPLFELPDTSLFSRPWPMGWYIFLFGLDNVPDGAFDLDWHDYVVVVSLPAGAEAEELPDFDDIVKENLRELIGE